MRHAGTFQIPTYAISMLEYDDTTGLTDLDIELVNGFIAANFPHGYVVDWTGIDQPYFASHPEFGIAAPFDNAHVTLLVPVSQNRYERYRIAAPHGTTKVLQQYHASDIVINGRFGLKKYIYIRHNRYMVTLFLYLCWINLL